MSEPEYRARLKIWNDARKVREGMFAQLRADIHNGSEMLQRRDKRRWEAADFGGGQRDPRSKLTPEEQGRRWREGVAMQFGEDGRAHIHGAKRKMHAVEGLKGTGQRFDIPRRA